MRQAEKLERIVHAYDEQQKLCSMAENKNYIDTCMNAKTDSLLLL